MGNNSTTPVVKRKYKYKSNVLKYSATKIIQNFIVIWLDTNINVSKTDTQHTVFRLQQIFSSINLMTDEKECIKFIEKTRDEQIFLIVSGALGKSVVPIVHKYIGLDSIYVFCGKPENHKWAYEWKKVKYVSNQIEEICQLLVNDTMACDKNIIPTSVFSTSESASQELSQIDRSFIYSLLLKEVLLQMNYDDQAITDFTKCCRLHFDNNQEQLRIIEEFEKNYKKNSPIWWYSRECFIYHMLNHSLRTVDIETLALMGFFLKDLHRQLEEIHSKRSNIKANFTLYRGQAMLNTVLDKIRNSIGGFLAFNSFVSTSEDINVALNFARTRPKQAEMVPIIFELVVDPTVTSVPFSSLNGISYFREGQDEKEVLFSMHSIFRITCVESANGGIYKIKLNSTTYRDLQVMKLIDQMRRELGTGSALERLGRLMTSLGELEKAEVFYTLLQNSPEAVDQKLAGSINSQMGLINYLKGNFSEARSFYEKALKMQENMRPSAHLDLATTYTNMGLLYCKLHDTDNALKYHKKALDIREKHLSPDDPDLATTYNNIGLVYDQKGDFTTALSYYEKTLKIYQQTLPENHSWLATAYKNIGIAQASMGNYKNGLENLNKALAIRKLILPSNHSSIASVYCHIGNVYEETQAYSEALQFYEKALDIVKQTPVVDDLDLANHHYHVSVVLSKLNKNNEAIIHAKHAIEAIRRSPKRDYSAVNVIEKHLKLLQEKPS